ncbi:hypothetical protein IV203_023962 [Nitzschia inconspicua]|uniref:Uncharacterized protein n=1 Tax=Nitzschia inconspicua TaxID=303405 RepID=A0A9K3KBT4_9STRA|nr:hypothetical protein IV203_024513 [Nitzschia inconspicua]KAG7340419.1 hypothetical protein IV203_023962 [Nitzschia inconspicua]
MSTAVTPTPGRGVTLPLPTATTKLSQQLQAHNSLFDVDLMLQDMIALTTKMTDTLFGEDDRARKKMKISYQDHSIVVTALTGAAAVSINGETTAKAFAFKREVRNELEEFKNAYLVIVDEVSFASVADLQLLDGKMKEILDRPVEPF